ncbi:DnaJ domain-containing protein [Paraburkholderia sp. CNPSo 3272]|uniref:DnaJ C-terminal domain-containing protein n=1 Tax=Paraburkholderia sp. CNPSo 3272 TaxID=2940931 RepID=UPI0020B80808|nr:DnaJ C-terminal domain-containing protein [Paraburkholderia sp. CNPSo 3272]MCP3721772.1 DnaJ domain-containing protein [Paraburkholderia sp. CNPSo 3272]
MSFEQYYRRLQLPESASPAEIKRAYRQLRAKYHPDRNKGHEAAVEPAFKLIQEAFEILSGRRVAPTAGTPGAADSASKTHNGEAQPRRRRAAPPMRGANCLVELFVPLEVAINGGGVQVHYPVKGPCPACEHEDRGALCEQCHGTGVKTWRKSEVVGIPGGAWDGQRLVVACGGHPGVSGGPSGDATFSVSIVCGPGFTRNGLDIACELPIDFVTAMLGGGVRAKVLGRTLEVKIPANANARTPIRLSGLGLAGRNGERGNLTLQLVLTMPAGAAHLTGAERQQLRDIFADAERRASQSPGSGSGSGSGSGKR